MCTATALKSTRTALTRAPQRAERAKFGQELSTLPWAAVFIALTWSRNPLPLLFEGIITSLVVCVGIREGSGRNVSCWIMRNSAGAAIMFTQTLSRTAGKIYWKVCRTVTSRQKMSERGKFTRLSMQFLEQPAGRVKAFHRQILKLFPFVYLCVNWGSVLFKKNTPVPIFFLFLWWHIELTTPSNKLHSATPPLTVCSCSSGPIAHCIREYLQWLTANKTIQIVGFFS